MTMLEYYEQRHPEYEAIYAKPERQDNLLWLECLLTSYVSQQRVLEIACGTGYWTRRMANIVCSIHATDASQQLASATLESCQSHHSVTSGILDAFDLPHSSDYDCVIAGFFYSHVLVSQQKSFLKGIAYSVEPGTRIVLFDNKYVEGSSTSISRATSNGDTYQQRILSNGCSHEVLKNFPTNAELDASLVLVCDQVEIHESEYFWLATGITKA